jgi:hypothetical protein
VLWARDIGGQKIRRVGVLVGVRHPARTWTPGVHLKVLVRAVVPVAARRRIWRAVVDRPVLSPLYFLVDPDVRTLRLTKRTDLVIDGFMRSANTYAVCAFQHANPSGIRVAHHLHNARVIERGCARGVPVLLTIRRPADAVASMDHFDPSTSRVEVLDAYVAFYARLSKSVDRMILADFDDVVGDFAAVLRRVNSRFGTSFAPYVKTDASERSVFASIEQFGATYYGGTGFESRVSRPSSERECVPTPWTDDERDALARADAVYEEIRSRAGLSAKPAPSRGTGIT